MKKFYQSALLAALGLGGVTAAHAQASTDLFIGFNDAVGSTSAQNDYVLDIGSFSALTTAANNNGGTINLMSASAPLQINATTFTSTFNSAYNADSSYLSDVAAGVIGGNSAYNLWLTAPTGITPVTINSTQLQTAAGYPQNVATGEYTSASGASSTPPGWTYAIAQSPTQAGTEGTGSFATAAKTNPMGQLSSGSLTLDLWENTQSGRNNPTGWVEEGYFTFSMSADGPDDITYTTPVPEPGTLALAGLGLAGLVAFRRRK